MLSGTLTSLTVSAGLLSQLWSSQAYGKIDGCHDDEDANCGVIAYRTVGVLLNIYTMCEKDFCQC